MCTLRGSNAFFPHSWLSNILILEAFTFHQLFLFPSGTKEHPLNERKGSWHLKKKKKDNLTNVRQQTKQWNGGYWNRQCHFYNNRDSDGTHAFTTKTHTFRDLVVMKTKREQAGCRCVYHRQKKCEKMKLVSTGPIFPEWEKKSCYTWVVSLTLPTLTSHSDFLPLFLVFVWEQGKQKKKKKVQE